VIITITYEEPVSQPTVSSSSVNLGSAVTIYTNRQSTATTHTLLYSFGSASGTIANAFKHYQVILPEKQPCQRYAGNVPCTNSAKATKKEPKEKGTAENLV